MGIIDPSSEYGEDISATYGCLLETHSVDDKRRLIIPSKLLADPALSFLSEENASPLAMSLAPGEGGILAGREDDILADLWTQQH